MIISHLKNVDNYVLKPCKTEHMKIWKRLWSNCTLEL